MWRLEMYLPVAKKMQSSVYEMYWIHVGDWEMSLRYK